MTTTINEAMAKGYTRKVFAECAEYEGYFLTKPDADTDGTFKAFNVDCGEFDRLNGWLWAIDDVGEEG